ncbi:hypothetical protein [Campylobacter sp. RM12647]|uniref:hypothetical protein n=1 Tax=Campylobacter sp. RM12647 TaxID=2735737 RepID=UPI001DDE560B|nr:hypothetical protein [Campylobacter sp. RM12647]
MSDLTTNENQNENKYDLFNGVLLVDVGSVTQYSLIHMSEYEITAESSINYEDAEKSLKNLASSLGFNCVLNVVRSNYTTGSRTTETMYTEGSSTGSINKGFFNTYNTTSTTNSTTTVNSNTKVYNTFIIKGILAIIGKLSPIGEIISINAILEREKMAHEYINVVKNIYNANYKMNDIPRDESKMMLFSFIFVVLLLQLTPYVGHLFFAMAIYGLFYYPSVYNDGSIDMVKKNIKESNDIYNIYESKLKNLVSIYGYDGVLNIYRLTRTGAIYNTSIKHIGA